MYRVHKARTIASTLRSVRDFQDAIVQAHVSKLSRNFQVQPFLRFLVWLFVRVSSEELLAVSFWAESGVCTLVLGGACVLL